ncbi:MAG: alpha/beta fold hydrolase [Deltaproteobacteria bacterium]|nr:alpha/beta fold hydrolase [Deltaproteobacteria bacterium]
MLRMPEKSIHTESIHLPGGEAGVLLLHGFTATPDSMRYLGEKLNRAGFTVLAPVLAGHGTRVEHLEQTRWQDWYRSVEDAFRALKAECRAVMVAGLSMGGLLAAHLAFHHKQAVRALGLMATPLFLDSFLVKGVFPAVWKTPLRHVYKYQSKGIASIKDPVARRRYQTYHKVPVVSVASMFELQKTVRQELKHLHHPTIILHSLHDETVPYGNLDYIQAILPGDKVEAVTLKKSNHIITLDYDKDLVAKRLIKFFKRHRK